MKPVSAILIGAGDRGMDSYAPYALSHPHRLRFRAVAEPIVEKLARFSEIHRIPAEMRVRDWRELIDQVHALVRGNWSRTEASCPMILGHCCHDVDLLYWFAGVRCAKVSSFGRLAHFRPDNAPPGAPARCLDGYDTSDPTTGVARPLRGWGSRHHGIPGALGASGRRGGTTDTRGVGTGKPPDGVCRGTLENGRPDHLHGCVSRGNCAPGCGDFLSHPPVPRRRESATLRRLLRQHRA